LDIHTLLYAAFMLMIGVQTLMFGAFVQVYSRVSGLKPMSPRVQKLLRPASLELGVFLGVVFLVMGAFGTISSLIDWKGQGFVHMDPQVGFRKVIPSTTLIFIGMQVIVSSFFMGVLKLGLPTRASTGQHIVTTSRADDPKSSQDGDASS
jgi:hypothetical protein